MALVRSPEKKNCPPPSSHETNVLSKFHDNWAKNVTFTVFTCFHYINIEKNAPPTGGHVFSPIPAIFKLVRDINKTIAKLVTSKVFTRENCHFIHIEKNAPPILAAMFFHLSRPFWNNDDWANIVTSRVFTRKTAPLTGGHVFQWIRTTF
ncbi:hypothetical protein DPMN_003332 [Dreissena polymorpha]|uniref:Uncharacterized protein n=1 Tax=Dreissena polymorpha TaxID=45954 RepID=A0A9D4MPH2_DREPO|nr:hypothetical protein DPMN_003332 [Dreissena polymorpha]